MAAMKKKAGMGMGAPKAKSSAYPKKSIIAPSPSTKPKNVASKLSAKMSKAKTVD